MEIIKTSIKVIIFTIMFFLFILFLSLLKGITIHNLNFSGNKIQSIFIKIRDNKLILNINISSLSPKRSKIELYKILSYLRLLKFTKELNLSTPEFNLNYKDNILTFNNNDIKLETIIKEKFSNVQFIVNYLIYKQIKLTNIHILLKAESIFYKINGYGYYNNFLIKFEGVLNPILNKLNLNIFSDNLNINWNNFLVRIISLNSKLKINLNNYKIVSVSNTKKIYLNNRKLNLTLLAKNISSEVKIKNNHIDVEAFVKNINTKYNNIPAYLKNISAILEDKILNVFIDEVSSNKIKELTNISANRIMINTNVSNLNKEIINIKNFKTIYKNYLISLKKIKLNIHNPYFNSFIKQGTIKDKNFTLLIKGINFSKNRNNIFYTINSTKLISKLLEANSSKIIGNKKFITNKIITGIFDEFNFKIKENKFDLKNKIFTSKKIIFNNVALKNIYIDFLKKYLTFKSNEYFDERINKILQKELNISIPIKQTAGLNNIIGLVKFDKNINFVINAYLKNPVLTIENLPFQALESNVTVTPDFTSFILDKAHLEIVPNMNLLFSGKGDINYTSLILRFSGIINNFTISPILNINNFKEILTFNLNTLEIFLKNANIYINLNKKNIIVNNLATILPYTPLNDIIENGILFISFIDNLKVLAYIKTKLSLFYKHNNQPVNNINKYKIDKLMLNIEAKDKKIILYNNFIKFFMDENNTFLTLKNIDINLYPLEKIYFEKNLSKSHKDDDETNKNIIVNLTDSNILYKNHKFLSQKAEIKKTNQNIYIKSYYKKSSLRGYTKNDYFLLEGKNFSKEEFEAFLPDINFFKEINIDFTLVKSPDNFYIGNVYINHGVINELKTLNNIIAFLNTIPSLLSLSSPGFSSKGYKIEKGNIQYLFYKKILYIKKAKIIGKNIDFISKGYIDFNKNLINLKTTAVLKLKIKKIPLIGKGLSYLFLGKDGNIKVHIIVTGDLNNPKIKKDLGKDLIPNPFKIFKRVITLPFNIF